MAKLESTFKNMVLVLSSVSCISAVLLGGAYAMTLEPIQKSETQKKERAIKSVTPAFDNSPAEESFKVGVMPNDSLRVYPIRKGGDLIAFAVETNTKNGFSGEIQVMVGYDMDGSIVNYSVLKHAETPGLGSKMGEWFSNPVKPNQYVVGRNPMKKELSVTKDNGDIDAITAATISSRAFLDAINRGSIAAEQAKVILLTK